MKTKEEIIEELLSKVKTERYPKQISSGGQSVGVPLHQGIKLTCEDTDFEIAIQYHRSQFKNAELCLKLYKQFLEEIL